MKFEIPKAYLTLSSNDVHIWRAELDQPASYVEKLAQTLSEEERVRAERFHFQRDRGRFIVGRGVLRAILGIYLGTDPSQLQLCYGPYGKPYLASSASGHQSSPPENQREFPPRHKLSPSENHRESSFENHHEFSPSEKEQPPHSPFEKGQSPRSPFEKEHPPYSPFEKDLPTYSPFSKGAGGISGRGALRFNLAHSHELALYAFARGREIGVDLEYIRRDLDIEQIAIRFFSSRENAVLNMLPTSQKPEAFFNCWTRKEAYIKAIGDGLAQPLHQFDVSLAPGEPARLLNVEGYPEEASRWLLRVLTPAPGYVAALAVEGHGWQLQCWQWQLIDL